MNDSRTNSTTVLKRRHLLKSFSLAAASQIAGCGETKDGDSEGTAGELTSRQYSTKETARIIERETEKLESVFDTLADLPIRKRDSFVFNVEQFENTFDHRTLVETCDSIKTELRSVNTLENDLSHVSVLITVTKIAKRLVQQRIVLHQVIAAGLNFQKAFYQTDFQGIGNIVTDARRYVTHLETLGLELEEDLERLAEDSPSIDGFDRNTIEDDQEMLLEIVLWTEPAYAGLHLVSKGVETFMEGNSALKDERYGKAGAMYNDSHDYFIKARETFERAQNEGTRLPYLAPFVDEVRCTLPVYLNSTTGLSESMEHLQRGEEKRGRNIAREAFKLADQAKARCE